MCAQGNNPRNINSSDNSDGGISRTLTLGPYSSKDGIMPNGIEAGHERPAKHAEIDQSTSNHLNFFL